MPIKKYRVDTDKGSYIVEVEEAEALKSADQQIREQRAPGFDIQTPSQAALAGFREGAVEGAKGFAKEIVPGTAKAVLGIPGAIKDTVKMVVSAGGEGAELFTDPVGTLTRWRDAAGELPGKANQALNDTIAMAANDPEKFGSAVADLTADTGVGFATAKALPTAMKPVVRGTGKLMQQVGTKGEWPIRMVGAHALGSGNPLGAAVMAAPEALISSGKRIERFGREGLSRLDDVAQRAAQLEGIETPAASGAIRLQPPTAKVARAVEAVDESSLVPAAGSREARILAAEQRAARATTPPLTPQEQALLDRATSVEPIRQGPRVTVTQPTLRPSAISTLEDVGDEIDLTAASGGAPNIAKERAAERFGQNFVDEGVTTPEGRGLPQELLDETAPPETLNVRPSKSKAEQLGGMTANDLDELTRLRAENPGLSLSELSDMLEEARAGRSSNYYQDALANAAMRRER